ncbi:MAG: hypothetical protein LUE27_01680 [Clostridia bacterium]|nr:hypothetical protein [Clostridia bacterium]
MIRSVVYDSDYTAQVYPVLDNMIVGYAYYIRMHEGAGEDVSVIRPLRERNFTEGFRCRFKANQLEECVRSFSAQAVYDSLCPRDRDMFGGDIRRIGIAGIVRLGEDRYTAVPIEYMSFTGAGNGRFCVMNIPCSGIRFTITDVCLRIIGKWDSVHLRNMLLAPYAGDMRRFHAEVLERCVVDAGRGLFVLLPEDKSFHGRLCMHVSKYSVMFRKTGDKVSMDILYNANHMVRSLDGAEVYSMHGSIISRMFRTGRYNYSDLLREVRLNPNVISGIRDMRVEITMPQTWHVLYKDCVLPLSVNCLVRSVKDSSERVTALLHNGIYVLEEGNKKYEVCMGNLADAIDEVQYTVEPRIYIKVPYKAVLRKRRKAVCIGLALSSGEVCRKPYYKLTEYSCIMNVEKEYFKDERCLGGSIWLAVPVGYKFLAKVMDTFVELSPVDVSRLLGALRRDYESASVSPGVSADEAGKPLAASSGAVLPRNPVSRTTAVQLVSPNALAVRHAAPSPGTANEHAVA